jgi:iron complex outermembrane receptor protein
VNVTSTPTGALITSPATRTTPYHASAPSYTFALDYKVSPDLLVYITTRRGYKPGGVNGTSGLSGVPGIREVFAPETLKDVEAGFKSDWAIGGVRGRTNVAAYHSWYSNIQRSEVITIPPSSTSAGGVTTQTNNIAAAKIYGLEMENTFKFTDSLSAFFNYAYTHAAYSKYPGTTVDILGGLHQNIDSPYIGVPKHQFTVGSRFKLPLPESAGELSVSGEYYHQSSIWLDDSALQDPAPFGRQKAFGELNLRADWNGVAGAPIDLAVFVRNVTNGTHLVGYGSQLASAGYAFGTYNEPRTFGVQARFRFGADAED